MKTNQVSKYCSQKSSELKSEIARTRDAKLLKSLSIWQSMESNANRYWNDDAGFKLFLRESIADSENETRISIMNELLAMMEN